MRSKSSEGNKVELEQYFRTNDKRLIHKWVHYFEIYERHFARFRDRECVIVEFGVSHGGSLQMWRDYFGPKARIFGIDIDERCQYLADDDPGTEILIGDQEDRDFLRQVVERIGPIDVVIEDGGHQMGQQIATFEEVYPAMTQDGVFLIEDLHTSYWSEFGGGFRKSTSFIEYAKTKIDQLNAWHSRDAECFVVDEFTRATHSMHVYDSIVAFERRPMVAPTVEKTGKPSFRPSTLAVFKRALKSTRG